MNKTTSSWPKTRPERNGTVVKCNWYLLDACCCKCTWKTSQYCTHWCCVTSASKVNAEKVKLTVVKKHSIRFTTLSPNQFRWIEIMFGSRNQLKVQLHNTLGRAQGMKLKVLERSPSRVTTTRSFLIFQDLSKESGTIKYVTSYTICRYWRRKTLLHRVRHPGTGKSLCHKMLKKRYPLPLFESSSCNQP